MDTWTILFLSFLVINLLHIHPLSHKGRNHARRSLRNIYVDRSERTYTHYIRSVRSRGPIGSMDDRDGLQDIDFRNSVESSQIDDTDYDVIKAVFDSRLMLTKVPTWATRRHILLYGLIKDNRMRLLSNN